MKLSASVTALLLSFGDVAEARRKTGKRTEDCDVNGYEVWQARPPEAAKLKSEARVDCDTETYTLNLSFEPDLNLPYINDVTATDPFANIAHPERSETCVAEGFGPGFTDSLPEGTHVGQNVHYTDYGYSYETSLRIQEATGFKLLTLGAAPCGIPIQTFPHYSIHFYLVDVEARKEMTCFSRGGYFCEPRTQLPEQCSDTGTDMNLDGVGLDMCEDGTTPANVFPGLAWTTDGGVISVNAAAPGMGLHGLNPADLAPPVDVTSPVLLMVQYDGNIVANHVLVWSGTALGENNPGEDFSWAKPTPEYNCQDKEKYPSLPTNTVVDYVAEEGRTYVTISGPTSQCTESFTEVYDSTETGPSGKSGKKKVGKAGKGRNKQGQVFD